MAPKTLEKTRKQIVKKKGAVGALHQGSRDSKRLHRAQVRDEKLTKLAASRRKAEQPLLDRVSHFKTLVDQHGTRPLSAEEVFESVTSFVHRHDDELDEAKKQRRPGRPPTTRETMVKMKVSALEKEFDSGFLMPDLASEENVSLLNRWEGSWSYLSGLRWVRVSRLGSTVPAAFPPK